MKTRSFFSKYFLILMMIAASGFLAGCGGTEGHNPALDFDFGGEATFPDAPSEGGGGSDDSAQQPLAAGIQVQNYSELIVHGFNNYEDDLNDQGISEELYGCELNSSSRIDRLDICVGEVSFFNSSKEVIRIDLNMMMSPTWGRKDDVTRVYLPTHIATDLALVELELRSDCAASGISSDRMRVSWPDGQSSFTNISKLSIVPVLNDSGNTAKIILKSRSLVQDIETSLRSEELYLRSHGSKIY